MALIRAPIDTPIIDLDFKAKGQFLTAPWQKYFPGMQSRLEDAVNRPALDIREFNSLVSEGDYSLAINAAIANQATAGGGIVRAPAITLGISQKIAHASNVDFRGAGRRATTIKVLDGAAGSNFYDDASGGGRYAMLCMNYVEDARISGMTFDANSANNDWTARPFNHVIASGMKYSMAEDLWFKNNPVGYLVTGGGSPSAPFHIFSCEDNIFLRLVSVGTPWPTILEGSSGFASFAGLRNFWGWCFLSGLNDGGFTSNGATGNGIDEMFYRCGVNNSTGSMAGSGAAFAAEAATGMIVESCWAYNMDGYAGNIGYSSRGVRFLNFTGRNVGTLIFIGSGVGSVDEDIDIFNAYGEGGNGDGYGVLMSGSPKHVNIHDSYFRYFKKDGIADYTHGGSWRSIRRNKFYNIGKTIAGGGSVDACVRIDPQSLSVLSNVVVRDNEAVDDQGGAARTLDYGVYAFIPAGARNWDIRDNRADGIDGQFMYEASGTFASVENGKYENNDDTLYAMFESPIGAPVVAASTIVALCRTFHITGATAIDTVSLTPGLVTNKLRVFLDGPCNFTTGGNMAKAVTGVAGRILDLELDVGTNKWYPSY